MNRITLEVSDEVMNRLIDLLFEKRASGEPKEEKTQPKKSSSVVREDLLSFTSPDSSDEESSSEDYDRLCQEMTRGGSPVRRCSRGTLFDMEKKEDVQEEVTTLNEPVEVVNDQSKDKEQIESSYHKEETAEETNKRYHRIMELVEKKDCTLDELVELTDLAKGEFMNEKDCDFISTEIEAQREREAKQKYLISSMQKFEGKTPSTESLLEQIEIAKRGGLLNEEQASRMIRDLKSIKERQAQQSKSNKVITEIKLKLPLKGSKEGDDASEFVDVGGVTPEEAAVLLSDRGLSEEKKVKYTKMIELLQRSSEDPGVFSEVIELARGDLITDEQADSALKRTKMLRDLMVMDEETLKKIKENPKVLKDMLETIKSE